MNKMAKKACAFLCVAFLFLSCLCAQTYAKELKDIKIREAAELMKKKPENLVILDVRTPAEFRDGHIPNAKNMDFFGGSFDMDISRLPKNDTIIVYCRSGKRSAGAADVLSDAGFKKVLHMSEGMEVWEKAGLPVEK